MSDHFFTRNPESLGLGVNMGLPADAMPGQGGKSMPVFSEDTYYDEDASLANNRPVVRQKVKCEIHIPGDRLTTTEHYVNPDNPEDPIIKRFPQEWARFAASRTNDVDPDQWRLEQWPMLNPAQVQMLKINHVHTVEQLAGLSDEQLSHVVGPGGALLRKHAKAAIQRSQEGAVPAQLVEENEALKASNKRNEQAIADLTAKLETLMRNAGQGDQVASLPSPEMLAFEKAPEPEKPAAPKLVEIPATYKKFGIAKLREICERVAPVPITTKDDALEVIGDYIAENPGALQAA
jgi:hypothetical protein